MANTKQAEKRVRQNKTRRGSNLPHLTRYRTYLKRARAAVLGGDPAKACEAAEKFMSVADSVSRKGIVPANRAARHKSRLAVLLRATKSGRPGAGKSSAAAASAAASASDDE